MVSVAVSTYQRASHLPRLIGALERQTLPRDRFEVVIADNGSTDETKDVLERLASESHLKLSVTRLESNRGPARGRNAAWRAAHGEIVAFTDDDCLPSPSWLERGLAAMLDGAGIVAGRTEPNPEQIDRLGPYAKTVWPGFARYFPTCNVFYWRRDLEAVDGFDESFGGPGAEDTDIAWRIKRLGRRPLFDDTAVVFHDVRPSRFPSLLRETLRWVDLPRVFAKFPEMRSEYLIRGVFWKRTHPRVLLAALGLCLALVVPPAVGLTLPWLAMRLRFRPIAPELSQRVAALPGTFVIDLLEVFVMLRGSIRHRTLVL